MNEQYIVDLKVKTPGVVPATKQIKALEAELAKLEKTSESYKQKQIEVSRVQNASGQSNQKFSKTVGDTKSSLGGLNKGLGSSIGSLSKFAGAAGVVASALVAVGTEILRIEKKFTLLQNTIQRTSGLTGKALDSTAVSVSSLAKTFGKETDEINKAANSFAQQTGIEYTEALSLIEKGLLSGADANGGFLDTLAEYPVQLKNAGFAAEDFIKVVTQGIDAGIFSDKLLESIKEADLALKEQTKATRDALVNAFGVSFTDDILNRIKIGSLSTKNALLEIQVESKKLNLTFQQQGQLTADIFKSAGEDAGGFEEVIKQLTAAQKINLEQYDELGTVQQEALRLTKELTAEELKLADTFSGLGESISNFTTEAQIELLSFFNTITDEFNLFDTRLNRLAKTYTESFKDSNPEEIAARLVTLRKSYKDVTEDIGELKKAISDTDFYRVDKLVTFNNQLDSSEENAARLAKEIAILEGFSGKKSVEGSVDPKKGAEKIDKVTTSLKKGKKAVIDYAAEFDKLRKSFEDNFETQRLEAQKDFLNGLISEEELQNRIFGINQQENAVLITIVANKKEAAKTGEEALEISRLEVEALQGQSDEIVRQLGLKNRLIEAEKNLRSAETDIRQSENRVDEENAIQEVITDASITTEVERQEKIAEIRKQFAIKDRDIQIEALKQQVKDSQAELGSLGSLNTDTGTEEGLINSEATANATKELAGFKAELEGLETQQLEAANSLDDSTTSTLDKLASKAEKINGYIQGVTQGFQQALEADIALTESKLDQQEVRIQAGVELAKTGNNELLNQELERQEKLIQEREKQANKEKAIAAIQVAANLAVAVAKAAAEGGGFGSIATIAATLGAVGVGLASISGLVSGFFADGVIGFQGKGTERSDSNLVAISRGESVITAKGTKNATKLLTAINEGKLSDDDYASAGLNFDVISDTNGVIDMRNELNEQIALNKELLEEFRSFEKKISFSSKGMTEYIRTKNKITTKLNTNR